MSAQKSWMKVILDKLFTSIFCRKKFKNEKNKKKQYLKMYDYRLRKFFLKKEIIITKNLK